MFEKIKLWAQRIATRKVIAAVVAAVLLAVGISLPPEQVDTISAAITEIISPAENSDALADD